METIQSKAALLIILSSVCTVCHNIKEILKGKQINGSVTWKLECWNNAEFNIIITVKGEECAISSEVVCVLLTMWDLNINLLCVQGNCITLFYSWMHTVSWKSFHLPTSSIVLQFDTNYKKFTHQIYCNIFRKIFLKIMKWNEMKISNANAYSRLS